MRLSEICEVYSGYAFRSFNDIKDGFPVVKIGNIFADGTLNLEKCQYTTDIVNEKYYSKKGDIYIALSGATTGKIGIMSLNQKYVINQRVGIVRQKSVDIPQEYIKYFLLRQTDRILQEATGCAQPNISPKQIAEYIIPDISKEQMQEICEVLNRIKKIIDSRKGELVALDNLIKARFVEMFGDININNKNWDCKPLGELCTIMRGGSPRPIEQFLGGEIPWIKIGDATNGDNIYLNSTKEHIIQEGVKKSRLVKSGSLIFANCGVSLGFARIITFDGCIHDGWLAMEDIDERLNKVFLLQALNQLTEHFRTIAPAGTQPNLNIAIMKAYKQVIPPIELQQEYVTFLVQIDKSKSVKI